MTEVALAARAQSLSDVRGASLRRFFELNRVRHATWFALLFGLCAGAAAPASAQENAPLVRLLHDARDFRVRVRAAFVLGNSGAPQSAASLEQALTDPHPAVRAAAATSLGQIGTPASLPALRRAQNDREPVVRAQATTAIGQIEAVQRRSNSAMAARSAGPSSIGSAAPPVTFEGKRYVVVVGDMSNRSEHQDGVSEQTLSREVLATMREAGDVLVLESSADLTAVARQVRERALPVLRLEGNLVRVTRRDAATEVSVRCEVSIMILDERERAVRSAVSGAASRAEQPSSRREEQQNRLVQQALVRAVRSALTNVSQAFAAAAAAQGASSAASEDNAERSGGGRRDRARRKRS